MERGADLIEVKITRAALGKPDIEHGSERHSNQNAQPAALGLDEHLHHHVVRDVVSGGPVREHEKQHRQCCDGAESGD